MQAGKLELLHKTCLGRVLGGVSTEAWKSRGGRGCHRCPDPTIGGVAQHLEPRVLELPSRYWKGASLRRRFGRTERHFFVERLSFGRKWTAACMLFLGVRRHVPRGAEARGEQKRGGHMTSNLASRNPANWAPSRLCVGCWHDTLA